MEPLTCPKCQGLMRSYERSGVTVDQCAQCGGLFLDRGELERLTQAEASYAQPPQAPPPPQPYPAQGGYPPPGYPGAGYPPPRRSFLENLFGDEHRSRGGHHGGHH